MSVEEKDNLRERRSHLWIQSWAKKVKQ